MDIFTDIEKRLRDMAASEPERAPLIDRILKRIETARKNASKDPDGWAKKAKAAGVDAHDMGCLCDMCIRFWGEVK